jgi:S-DNA-T family DNA segregation ATPase FtsK/SpoIIIE
VLFLAVVLFLILWSHNPGDPSFSRFSTATATGHVKNLIGPIGAHLSALFIDLFGLVSFWLVLALLAASLRLFRGRPFDHPWLVVAGLILFLLSATAGLSMAFPKLKYIWPGAPGGGILGDALAKALIRALNPVGAGLSAGLVFIISLLLSTSLSLFNGAERLSAAFAGIRSFWSRWWTPGVEDNEEKEEEPAPTRAVPKEKPKPSEELKIRVVDKPEPKAQPKPEPKKPVQEAFDFPSAPESPYQLPGPELLDEPKKSKGGLSRDILMANARLVEKKLADFNVPGEVVEVSTGPVITMYEYKPAPGVKISKVAGLADDLALNMKAPAIRIVAPLPGKAAIGLEIPNPTREFVCLQEIVDSVAFAESRSLLSLVMGVDIMGQPEVADLQKMPHLLIAGATGSGKSVGLNAIIMSILFKARPDEVRFLMIDPKRIELTPYKDLPHLIYPVVSEPAEANKALKWAVADMEHRYQLLAEKGVRNIESYNRQIRKELAALAAKPPVKKAPAPPEEALDNGDDGDEDDGPAAQPPQPEPLPYLVIIIDELADLMMVSAKEVETSITRLAQMARAAGIHLILATQRPSVDVLTGVIKANLPTRVSFQVSSKIDARTILDTQGSEKLLGMGDMLFLPPGTGKIRRIHGAFVSDEEIQRVTSFIKAQAKPQYLEDLDVPGQAADGENGGDEHDDKYDEALALVTRTGKASISLIQRHLRIGYNRAARIIEIMEREGVVGPADGAKPRPVIGRDY